MCRYEAVKADKVEEMGRVMNFLGFKYKRKELEKRLSDDYQTFKR